MKLHQIDPKTGRWLGASKTVADTAGIPRGWLASETDPLLGQRWGGPLLGWIGSTVAAEGPYTKLRTRISKHYDALVAAGLEVAVPGLAVKVKVLPQDVILLNGGGAATASRLAMWQALGQTDAYNADASAVALTDYNFGKVKHTLTNGQFASLYLGYFKERDECYQAHARAKTACDNAVQPDQADLDRIGFAL